MSTDKQKRIDELKEEVKEKRTLIKAIDVRLSGKITDDIEEYEVWSDIVKRKISRYSLKDLISVREVYKTELRMLETELKKCERREPREILMRFRD